MDLNLIDYKIGVELAHADIPITALIAAAVIRADDYNQQKLLSLFPEIFATTKARYNAGGGFIEILDNREGKTPTNDIINRAAEVADQYLKKIQHS